jgi:hypothetical protein
MLFNLSQFCGANSRACGLACCRVHGCFPDGLKANTRLLSRSQANTVPSGATATAAATKLREKMAICTKRGFI